MLTPYTSLGVVSMPSVLTPYTSFWFISMVSLTYRLVGVMVDLYPESDAFCLPCSNNNVVYSQPLNKINRSISCYIDVNILRP